MEGERNDDSYADSIQPYKLKEFLQEELRRALAANNNKDFHRKMLQLKVFPNSILVYTQDDGRMRIKILRSSEDIDTIELPEFTIENGDTPQKIFEKFISFIEKLPTNAVESMQFWCRNIAIPRAWDIPEGWWEENKETIIDHVYNVPDFNLFSNEESENTIRSTAFTMVQTTHNPLHNQSFITSFKEDPWCLHHIIEPHAKVLELQNYIRQRTDIDHFMVDIRAFPGLIPVKPEEQTKHSIYIPLDFYGELDEPSLAYLHTFLIRVRNKCRTSCIHLVAEELVLCETEEEDKYGLDIGMQWKENDSAECRDGKKGLEGLRVKIFIDKVVDT